MKRNLLNSDGSIGSDNDIDEREMKCVVFIRESRLFVEVAARGRTAAILVRRIGTFRRHHVEMQRYLTLLPANQSQVGGSQPPPLAPRPAEGASTRGPG